VYPFAGRLSDINGKVATPETATIFAVPVRSELPGFAKTAIEMSTLDDVTTFPPASSTDTAIAGTIDESIIVLDGCTVNTS
jgi:hypothetical protein